MLWLQLGCISIFIEQFQPLMPEAYNHFTNVTRNVSSCKFILKKLFLSGVQYLFYI